MSGQSAHLTLKEACAMQERVQASGSHACSNGGSSSGGGMKKMGKKKSMTSTGDSMHKKMK